MAAPALHSSGNALDADVGRDGLLGGPLRSGRLGGWATGLSAAFRYGLGFACFFFLIVATGVVMRGTAHRQTDIRTVTVDGGAATELRQSRRLWVLLVALMGACATLPLAGAVEIYLNVPSSFIPGASAVLGLFGAYCASFLVVVAARRVRCGEIQLTPTGIFHRGWSFDSYLPWEAVAGATDSYPGYRAILVVGYANAVWQRRYMTRLWRIDRLPTVPLIEVDCRKFAIDEALLFHLVLYYANNPSARTELGTAVAIERARAGDYPSPATGLSAL